VALFVLGCVPPELTPFDDDMGGSNNTSSNNTSANNTSNNTSGNNTTMMDMGAGGLTNPFTTADMPAVMAGETLYGMNGCGGCHGATGGGGIGSPIDDETMANSTDEFLFLVLRDGEANTSMFAYGANRMSTVTQAAMLSDEQLWQLVTYIRVLSAE